MGDEPLTIEERRRRRGDFLLALYDAVQGDPAYVVNLADIGESLGWSVSESWEVRNYLGSAGYLQGVTGLGGISITHEGVKAAERIRAGRDELLHPEASGGNVVNIENAINSQIQQGTTDSTQQMEVSEQTIGDIRSFVGDLRGYVDDLGLSEENRREVDAQITTVDAQLASRKPRWTVVRDALTDVRDVIKAAKEIGGAATPILAALARILGGL